MEEIRQDTEIMVINDKLPSLQSKIEALVVKDEPSSKLMTDYCGFIKDAISKVEEKRKFYTGPLNETIKRLNNDAKSITSPLSELLMMGKGKIMDYLNAVRIREAAEAVAKQVASDKVAKDMGLPNVEIRVEEKRQIKSGIGAVHTSKHWDFELEDFLKVPNDYKALDEVKVRAMIRMHTQVIKGASTCDLKIEGIKIFQREDINIRT